MFVDDYRPSYSPSPTSNNNMDDQATVFEWENKSQTSGGHEDEESLFIGSEPTHLRHTPSATGPRSYLSPTRSTESREVKQENRVGSHMPEDPTDKFLPAESLEGTASESRKRVNVGGGHGSERGGGSASAKRARTGELGDSAR